MTLEKHSNLLVLIFSIALVFTFHFKALGFGFAQEELNFLVRATPSNLTETVQDVYAIINSPEPRPINNYLFFLAHNKILGNNPQAFHFIILLLQGINGFLLYLFIFIITKNKRIAFLTLFAFLTRGALHRGFYCVAHSAPKLLFFMLLTLIFYLKRADNKKLFLSLSIFTYILALFSRESAVFLPVLIISYEIIFNFNCKISLSTLKTSFKQVIPYLAAIIAYTLVRIPFLTKLSLTGKSTKSIFQLDNVFKLKQFAMNLANYFRFNYNALTFPLEKISFGNIWPGLIDVGMYFSILILLHLTYTTLSRRSFPALSATHKKGMLWGSIWFLTFILLYCLLESISMHRMHIPTIGFCLVIACLADYYYSLLIKKNSLLCYGITIFLLLHFIIGFYFLSQKKLQEDEYLGAWKIVAGYMAASKKLYPSIPPGKTVHLYGVDYRGRTLPSVANSYQYSYMLQYLYKDKNLKVVRHGLQPDYTKIEPGDIVFKLEKDKLINHANITK